jgi:hypothetical protein
MNMISKLWSSIVLMLVFTLLAGCGGSPQPDPLSAKNLNLIFVVSEDLNYNAPGDINPTTANLTTKGLRRSLSMGTFLKRQVLGGNNVTGIYAIEPMTHLQTANDYPDMVGLEAIQQFALLNEVSAFAGNNPPYTADSYPIFTSYAANSVPAGVAPPLLPCPACQGIDFKDENGDNETLVGGIVNANVPGFYVFSAPWETVSAIMANLNQREGYNLSLPASYAGPNDSYAISIAPSERSASLATYDSHATPSAMYPVFPSTAVAGTPCSMQTPFKIQVTAGSGGAVAPAAINTSETLYFIRHVEAHPVSYFEDGNYVAAGQWRALDLPNALRGKIQPTQVYSIDPAFGVPSGTVTSIPASYVRAALTAAPYAIANNLPFNLAAGIPVFAQNPPQLSTLAAKFFFTGGQFSNQATLAAWEHLHIPTTVNALIASYFPNGGGPQAPNWPDNDYDTVWTVTLDAQGNLTVDNRTCEGINSADLPTTPPQF